LSLSGFTRSQSYGVWYVVCSPVLQGHIGLSMKICLWFLYYVVNVSDTSQSFTGTEDSLVISVSLSMAFTAEAHPTEGHIRSLKLNIFSNA
jgi:hypothetical protein